MPVDSGTEPQVQLPVAQQHRVVGHVDLVVPAALAVIASDDRTARDHAVAVAKLVTVREQVAMAHHRAAAVAARDQELDVLVGLDPALLAKVSSEISRGLA